MLSKVIVLIVIICCLVSIPCQSFCKSKACVSPIQVSFISPLQLVPEKCSIYGVKLNAVYGYNKQVVGLDTGLLGNVDKIIGVQANLLANNAKDCRGLQISPIGNICTDIKGIQIGAANSCSNNMVGLQVSGTFNFCWHEVNGVQIGFGNFVSGKINESSHIGTINGLQIGLINFARNMNGVQIGLINVIQHSKIPVMVLFNVGID